ncbi:MAG: polysaccharide deacetylase family protein [Flavobacterium sp.]|nr:polysaccharide deacetylase family protein [Flavobacterium sp.]
MSFWMKTNRLIKLLFPKYVWDIPNEEQKVFLTFDDGPTPAITEWVLEQLRQYDSKATFFCIGNNIEKHPEIFKKIIAEGHAIGNHTFNHLNGWKTTSKDYFESVKLCHSQFTNHNSQIFNLFRPPYGKIKPSQSKRLRKLGYKIIMWDVLSYDFDKKITREKCLDNVLQHIESGSIIVFHDSNKAWNNLEYVLPKTLIFLKERGFICDKID